jgi:predicted naringenin-chalcone synthase
MRVAQAFGESNPEARVLLCAVELCSLHYRFNWDPDRFIGNLLFADGAAALACGPGDRDQWRVVATGSCLVPDSTDAMTWRIGDHGFEMTLSPRVPDLIHDHFTGWLAQWLAQHGTTSDEIDHWAVHPGGPRILTAVEQTLGLDPAATALSREVLSTSGNMSSPTILFILDRLRQKGATGRCVALGFGPGLVAEAALLELS